MNKTLKIIAYKIVIILIYFSAGCMTPPFTNIPSGIKSLPKGSSVIFGSFDLGQGINDYRNFHIRVSHGDNEICCYGSYAFSNLKIIVPPGKIKIEIVMSNPEFQRVLRQARVRGIFSTTSVTLFRSCTKGEFSFVAYVDVPVDSGVYIGHSVLMAENFISEKEVVGDKEPQEPGNNIKFGIKTFNYDDEITTTKVVSRVPQDHQPYFGMRKQFFEECTIFSGKTESRLINLQPEWHESRVYYLPTSF